MELATLCTVVASLRVVPNRVQFFQYETVSLSCASEWTIVRNTSLHKNQRNPPQQNKSSWVFIHNIYYRDGGVYWCQSEEGECGAAVNITVTDGDVILESPVQPVTEGETVTLRCLRRDTSKETFGFFKDGSWIGNSTSGDLTLPRASAEDSGLYSCRSADELSAESRLVVVKAERPSASVPSLSPPPHRPMKIPLYRLLCFLFLFLLFTAVLCIGLSIYRRRARARGEEEKLESEPMSLRRVRNP